MSLKRLSINAAAAAAQSLATTVAMVGMYSIMVRELGIEQVGLWSLLISLTALGRLGESGLGVALMRFTSKHLGTKEFHRVRPTILTCLLIMLTLTGLLAVVFYPLIAWLLGQLVNDPQSVQTGISLIPIALGIMIATALSGLFFGLIDAYQKTHLRAIVVTVVAALQLTAGFWIIPAYGLEGLAWLQLAYILSQVAGTASIGMLLLQGTPGRWQWQSWRELIELVRFGAGLQINAIAQLAFEPTVKALITYFGGLAMTGYFEVGNRAVTQLRLLVITAFQMLVPYVAGKYPSATSDASRLQRPYRHSARLMQAMVCAGLPILLASLPIALPLWIKVDSQALLIIAWICAFGWAINMLTTPAYFFALGIGRIRWTIESHVVIGLLCPLLGLLGGLLAGAIGVAAGAMFALAIGSVTAPIRLSRHIGQPISATLSKTLVMMLTLNLLALTGWLVLGPEFLPNMENSFLDAAQRFRVADAGRLALAVLVSGITLALAINGLGWRERANPAT